MLLDTYAWIELIKGTKQGEIVKAILKQKPCFTSQISIAELVSWCEKNSLDSKKYLSFVKSQSKIIPITNDLLELAGKIHYHKRITVKDFGLIDAIILATSKQFDFQVLTGDKHFETENTMFLEN